MRQLHPRRCLPPNKPEKGAGTTHKRQFLGRNREKMTMHDHIIITSKTTGDTRRKESPHAAQFGLAAFSIFRHTMKSTDLTTRTRFCIDLSLKIPRSSLVNKMKWSTMSNVSTNCGSSLGRGGGWWVTELWQSDFVHTNFLNDCHKYKETRMMCFCPHSGQLVTNSIRKSQIASK